MNIKEEILLELEKKASMFKKVSPIRYRMRCPFCGDSQSDPRKAHLYIKCEEDPTSPMLYYCFKGNCGAKGIVDQEFLDKFDIHIKGIEVFDRGKYKKLSTFKNQNIELVVGTPFPSKQTRYVESRLGKGFDYEDYDKFKIIWDFEKLKEYIRDDRTKNTLPSNNDSISFLSEDKSFLLTRFFDGEQRWRKNKLFSSNNRLLYTIKSMIDIFTEDEIVVNIAEGIFDVLSIYKNFSSENGIYIATLGSDYSVGMDYVIDKGIFGENVTVKIFMDDDIQRSFLRKTLKRFKWLFKEIHIVRNLKYKDVGTILDQIELSEEYL